MTTVKGFAAQMKWKMFKPSRRKVTFTGLACWACVHSDVMNSHGASSLGPSAFGLHATVTGIDSILLPRVLCQHRD